jgi:hypothetical protein
MRRFSVLLALSLLALACGSAGTNDPTAAGNTQGSGGTGTGGDTGAGGASGEGGAGGGITVGNGGSTAADDCGGVGKLIYIVSSEKVLLSFQPKTHDVAKIGDLNCPAGFGASPFSMAVDRKGMAFVLYDNGQIFLVDTKDASCKPSAYQPGQHGFTLFGMGWVSDGPGASTETLYVIDYSSFGGASMTGNKGLASIDNVGMVHPIANFDGGLSGRAAEVTGLGDGRLFGFFVDSNDASKTTVAEIERTTGHVISNEPQNITVGAWAFAHWGGSFYLFAGSGIGGTSRVHKYTPGTGTTQIVNDLGYRIVGAGVSTCAPIEEPIE